MYSGAREESSGLLQSIAQPNEDRTMTEKIPLVDLIAVHQELEEELAAVFKTALRSSAFGGGPMEETFEREFAEVGEAQCCVGVRSGTDALRVDVGPAGGRAGEAVGTVPNAFV